MTISTRPTEPAAGQPTERIINARTGGEIAARAIRARNFFSRFLGLLGRRNLPRDEALILTSCSMVHMWFMLFPIDVLFCSKDNIVVGIEALRPWRLSRFYSTASYAVELAAGRAAEAGVRSGDVL